MFAIDEVCNKKTTSAIYVEVVLIILKWCVKLKIILLQSRSVFVVLHIRGK